MKIQLVICNVVAVLFIGYFFQIRTQTQDDYEIYQSFRFSSPSYTDTRLNVVVNITDYEVEGLFDDIREFHNKLNGEPDELTISLYDSREGYRAGECIGIKTYFKDNLAEE